MWRAQFKARMAGAEAREVSSGPIVEGFVQLDFFQVLSCVLRCVETGWVFLSLSFIISDMQKGGIAWLYLLAL